MFNDKKLRNTFWLAVLAAITPICLLCINDTSLFASTNYYDEKMIVISGIAEIISIYGLTIFILNWKKWEPLAIKIIGVVISLTGIVLGIYSVCFFYLDRWPIFGF
jgi:hypothetical protein